MKTLTRNIEPPLEEASMTEKMICSKCGRQVKSPRDWVRSENGIVLCGFCYLNYMFPLIHENYTEVLD